MNAQEIKTGLTIRFKPTGNLYKVTRTSEKSVWYELLLNGVISRVSINTFNEMLTNGRWETI